MANDENFYGIVVEESGEIESPSYDEPLVYVHDPITIKGTGHATVFGLCNRFDVEFPPTLNGKIAPEEFTGTVQRINRILRKMVSLNLKWLFVGCLCCCCTIGCSVWPVICLNKRAKCSLRKALEWENRQLYHKLGLHWNLSKRRLSSTSMLEYVLLIEFIPQIPVYQPD